MLEIALLVLSILFLCGLNVGVALAICCIVEVGILILATIVKKIRKSIADGNE